jgi:hypothetical protein
MLKGESRCHVSVPGHVMVKGFLSLIVLAICSAAAAAQSQANGLQSNGLTLQSGRAV